VGKGTRTLAGLRKGESVNIIYPLGNSFSLPSEHQRILLIGGGCGVAPLLFLARFLKSNGYIFDILMGFKNSNSIIEFKEFKKLADIFLTTEDGSAGEKGFVIHHSILKKNNYDRIYCCGPESMMKAVARYSMSDNIVCEVSLENLMACGIGACLCCVVSTTRGNICSCTEGPVFNIKDLKW
jgi:dihydroorotate dehydrogenase electron transfer subunit